MVNEITLSKGIYSVTIYTTDVADNFQNKIIALTPPTGRQNQSDGPKPAKLIDLLRVTRTIKIKGYIISNTVKADLIALIKGAKANGGTITLTYPNGGDSAFNSPGTATTYEVLIETCTINDKAFDEPTGTYIDGVWQEGVLPSYLAKFLIDMSVLEGTTIGGS